MGYLERVKINNLLVVLVSVILLFITGCGHKENETTNNVTDISYTQPSSFSRSTEIHSLSEEANPYLMRILMLFQPLARTVPISVSTKKKSYGSLRRKGTFCLVWAL